MRPLFDQYAHPENRLTHALASCLAEDPALLASFLRWLGVMPPRGAPLHAIEQRLPGDAEERDPGAEPTERRLPDAWVYADTGWALLIESKIAAPIDPAQLRGHLVIAERRGFDDLRLLVLSPLPPARALPDRCLHRRWSDLYEWASAEAARSRWATHLVSYFPVAEQRMVDDGYLREGTLTTFAGIPFSASYPYTYLEAKRLLRLLMAALRTDASLDALGIDRTGAGRPAISEGADSVWDFLPLTLALPDAAFNRFPHLTVSIHRDRANLLLTLPNSLDGPLRRHILDGGYEAFKAMIDAFVTAAEPVLAADPGAMPLIVVQQRRYASQRSVPVRDALLEFDPRTATGRHPAIKHQEEWLRASYEAFASRRSNLQLAIGVAFSYAQSRTVHEAVFADTAVATCRALQPLLARVQGKVPGAAPSLPRRRNAA